MAIPPTFRYQLPVAAACVCARAESEAVLSHPHVALHLPLHTHTCSPVGQLHMRGKWRHEPVENRIRRLESSELSHNHRSDASTRSYSHCELDLHQSEKSRNSTFSQLRQNTRLGRRFDTRPWLSGARRQRPSQSSTRSWRQATVTVIGNLRRTASKPSPIVAITCISLVSLLHRRSASQLRPPVIIVRYIAEVVSRASIAGLQIRPLRQWRQYRRVGVAVPFEGRRFPRPRHGLHLCRHEAIPRNQLLTPPSTNLTKKWYYPNNQLNWKPLVFSMDHLQVVPIAGILPSANSTRARKYFLLCNNHKTDRDNHERSNFISMAALRSGSIQWKWHRHPRHLADAN